MKKSTRSLKSLKLDRETVRTLVVEDLRLVNGGLAPDKTITCRGGSDCCSYQCTSYSCA